MGICDRATGKCVCVKGFEGLACERSKPVRRRAFLPAFTLSGATHPPTHTPHCLLQTHTPCSSTVLAAESDRQHRANAPR